MGCSAISPIRQLGGYTVGLGARYNMRNGFLVRAELQYNYSKVQYGVREITSIHEGYSRMDLNETNHVISLPLSIGVELGIVRITSGVNANAVVQSTTTLVSLEDMADNSPQFYMGWHAGTGINLNKFGIELRYTQGFRNYGQGYSIGNKELTFYGNPFRWSFILNYTLGRAK